LLAILTSQIRTGRRISHAAIATAFLQSIGGRERTVFRREEIECECVERRAAVDGSTRGWRDAEYLYYARASVCLAVRHYQRIFQHPDVKR